MRPSRPIVLIRRRRDLPHRSAIRAYRANVREALVPRLKRDLLAIRRPPREPIEFNVQERQLPALIPVTAARPYLNMARAVRLEGDSLSVRRILRVHLELVRSDERPGSWRLPSLDIDGPNVRIIVTTGIHQTIPADRHVLHPFAVGVQRLRRGLSARRHPP